MFGKLCFCLLLIGVSSFRVPPKIVPVKNTGARIVGGEEATLGQVPWEALLYVESDAGTTQCAGAIIDPEWIVTSADCIDGASSVTAITGVVDSQDANRIETKSADLVVHEQFEAGSMANNIGLVRLETPLEFDDNTRSIEIALFPILTNVSVAVSGWGVTADGSTSPSQILNVVHLETIDLRDCEAVFGDGSLALEIICAVPPAGETKSPCLGDGGAPLVSDFDNNPQLEGIFVFVSSAGCEAGDPSGYIRVEVFLLWIEQHIRGGLKK